MRFRLPFLKQNRSQEDVAFIRFFVNRFGYRPKNIELFYQAVTHRSIAYHGQKDFSNERLEFLGDAILDSIIAEFLFQRFPEEDEGYLTKVKSKVVSRKTLTDIVDELELRSILGFN